jgi:hypothetical protein
LELLLWFLYAVYIVPRLMCLFKPSPFALVAMDNFKKSEVQRTFSRFQKLSTLIILWLHHQTNARLCTMGCIQHYPQESNCSYRLTSQCTTKIATSAYSIHHVRVTNQQKAQRIMHLFISPLVNELYCFVCWIK